MALQHGAAAAQQTSAGAQVGVAVPIEARVFRMFLKTHYLARVTYVLN